MKLCHWALLCLSLCLILTVPTQAQENRSLADRVLAFPDKLAAGITKKAEATEEKLLQQTEKYLAKLKKQEAKLKKQLAKTDSLKAKELFGDADQFYSKLEEKVKSKEAALDKFNNVYSGHLDSLTTAFKFFEENKLFAQTAGVTDKYKEVFAQCQSLQKTFNNTEEIKKYLQQRQQFLKQQLANTPLAKQFRKYQEQVYYYKAQVDEYKQLFEQPDKLTAKVLGLLQDVPAFRNFFNKFSDLAGIFNLPGNDPLGSISLTGLQTRAGLQQEMMQRLGAGPNMQQVLSQGVADAQSQLNQLKEKLRQIGSEGGDMDMPDFKPNQQKTKSLLQRIELGTNMQTVKKTSFFPSTTDFALTAAYRINDKSIAGVGMSYKMGWGQDIRHIALSHQGMGMRSFVDIKIKGGFWISGGGELNYKAQFRDFSILNDYSPWQKSFLLGLSKKYKAGKKLNGNFQLLYDFLWQQQVPRTQPVVWRLGYNF